MRIATVLRAKGSMVATVTPGTSIAGLLAEMVNATVGAVVVVEDDAVVGMVWERDLVRLLHEHGASLAGTVVADIMNADVVTCVPADELDHILRIMTDRRIRHLPVCRDHRLVGIVSIGDLVKVKIAEAEAEAETLKNYIAAG